MIIRATLSKRSTPFRSIPPIRAGSARSGCSVPSAKSRRPGSRSVRSGQRPDPLRGVAGAHGPNLVPPVTKLAHLAVRQEEAILRQRHAEVIQEPRAKLLVERRARHHPPDRATLHASSRKIDSTVTTGAVLG